MARKNPSFGQLIAYFHEPLYDRKAATFAHNFYQSDTPQTVVDEFEHNATFLPKRANGNFCYHEIIALPDCPEVSRNKQERILLDLVRHYVQLRAPRQLAYGRMHLDKHLHFHLCISANAVRGRQRLWLSKGQFANIQAELECYKLERYPELGDRRFYQGKERPRFDHEELQAGTKLKQTLREGEFKRRTQLLTRKEQIRSQLLPLFANAVSQADLEVQLNEHDFSLYQRGRHEGVIDHASGKHYRLATLGLSFARFVLAEREAGYETSEMERERSGHEKHGPRSR